MITVQSSIHVVLLYMEVQLTITFLNVHVHVAPPMHNSIS